jgi:hypothetical protein
MTHHDEERPDDDGSLDQLGRVPQESGQRLPGQFLVIPLLSFTRIVSRVSVCLPWWTR